MNPRSLAPSATEVPIGFSPVKRTHANGRNTDPRRGRQGQVRYVSQYQVRAQVGERAGFHFNAVIPPGMQRFVGIGSLVGEDLEW